MKWLANRGGSKLDDHATDEQLVLLHDGELPEPQAARIRQHLNSCWHCRGRAAGFEQTITLFSMWRSAANAQTDQRFTATWSALRLRLRQSAKQMGSYQAATRSGWLARAAAALLVFSFGLSLWSYLRNPAKVSAAELVERSLQAENARLSRTNHPVVRVRMEVRYPGRQGPAAVEIWHDRSRGRMRQAGDHEAFEQLRNIMAANSMGGLRPLSMEAFSAWRSSVRSVNSTVSNTTLAGGESAYELKVRAEGATPPGRIASITTVIRKSDLHPVRQTMFLKAHSGHGEFDLIEKGFELFDGTLIPTNFFQDPLAPGTETATEPGHTDVTVDYTAPASKSVTAQVSLVEILYALHRAHACNDQIQVEREDAGRFAVKGIVDSLVRQQELIESLGGLPGVSVDLRIPSAVPMRDLRPADGPESSSGFGFTTRSELSPLEVILQHQGPGASLSASLRAVRGITACMREAWALRRLAQSVSVSEETSLLPASRMLLDRMIRDHGEALGRASMDLRALLETLGPEPGDSSGPDVAPFASSWREQVTGLLAAFERADNAIRILISPPPRPVPDPASYAAEARSAIGAALLASAKFERGATARSTPGGGRREQH